MRIKNAQLKDDGDYVCRARNHAGLDQDYSRLDVQQLPEIEASLDCPKILHYSDNKVCIVNPIEYDTFMIACNSTGDPKPTVRYKLSFVYFLIFESVT